MPSRRPSTPKFVYATRIAGMASLATEPALDLFGRVTVAKAYASREELDRALDAQFGDDEPPLPTEPRARARVCLARTVGSHVGPSRRRALVDEALHLDPGNADAQRLTADRIDDPSRRLEALDRAIAVGLERAGGEAAVRGARPNAWRAIEMRPYLRARGRHVETLMEAGRVAEAVVEAEAVLELEDHDPMGMRHYLAVLHLVAGKPGAFRRLAKALPLEADTPLLAWGAVLAALLCDDEAGARAARARAASSSPAVAEMLLEPWDAPDLPATYGDGTTAERVVAAHALFPAFSVHSTALAWLLAATPSVKPRSSRVRHVLASLRPGVDQGDEPRWLEWLLRSRGDVPEALRTAVRLDGERGVAWVCSLLARADLDRSGTIGSGYGPTAAARLLAHLPCAVTAAALVRALATAEPESSLAESASVAFRAFGVEAVEPLLAGFGALPAGTEGDERRLAFGEALADLGENGVRDDRILEVLVGLLRLDLGLGTMNLATYGDPRGVAPIRAAFAGIPIDFDDHSTVSNMDLFDAFDAIEALGATLTPEEAATRKRILSFRTASELDRVLGESASRAADQPAEDDAPGAASGDAPDADLLEGEFEGVVGEGLDERARFAAGPAGAPEFPGAAGGTLSRAGPGVGRNAPCPCGSGRKYKKCCGASGRPA